MCSDSDFPERDHICQCVFEVKLTRTVDGYLQEFVLGSCEGHLKLGPNSPEYYLPSTKNTILHIIFIKKYKPLVRKPTEFCDPHGRVHEY